MELKTRMWRGSESLCITIKMFPNKLNAIELQNIYLRRRVEDLSSDCRRFSNLYQLSLKEIEDLKSLIDKTKFDGKANQLNSVQYLNERNQLLIDNMKSAHEIEIKHLKELISHKNEVI
jgi:hypothetical protein